MGTLPHNYFIGEAESGEYYAISAQDPAFCFRGASEADVKEKALKAFAFFFSSDQRKPKRGPLKPNVATVLPTKVEELQCV